MILEKIGGRGAAAECGNEVCIPVQRLCKYRTNFCVLKVVT